jgi:hypothetical protein
MLVAKPLHLKKVKKGDRISRQLTDNSFIGDIAPSDGVLISIGTRIAFLSHTAFKSFIKDKNVDEIDVDSWADKN